MASLKELLDAADDSKVVNCTGDRAIKVSTGKGENKTSTTIDARLPKTIQDAVDIFGAKKAHRLLINSLVVALQGEVRNSLTPKGEKKERKKAAYLEEMGL